MNSAILRKLGGRSTVIDKIDVDWWDFWTYIAGIRATKRIYSSQTYKPLCSWVIFIKAISRSMDRHSSYFSTLLLSIKELVSKYAFFKETVKETDGTHFEATVGTSKVGSYLAIDCSAESHSNVDILNCDIV